MQLRVRVEGPTSHHSLTLSVLVALVALALPAMALAQAPCPPDTIRATDGDGGQLFQWEFNGSMPDQGVILGTPPGASGVRFSTNFTDGTGLAGISSGSALLGLRLSAADRYLVEEVGSPGSERASLVARLHVTLQLDSYFYHGAYTEPEGVIQARLESPAGGETRDVVVAIPPSESEFDLTAPFDVTFGEPFEIRTLLRLERARGAVSLSSRLTFGVGAAGSLRMSSCNGYSVAVPVQPTTWSSLKTLYR